jgi:hypothetical protein
VRQISKICGLLSASFLLISCENKESFGKLEETEAFSNNHPDAPLLTRFTNVLEFGKEDIVRLDFNNEKIGSDEDMVYSCRFDDVQDGVLNNEGTDCEQLPDSDGQAFDKTTGVLHWGPFTNLAAFDVAIIGENPNGREVSVVQISIIESKVPHLERILDQTVAADSTLNLQAVNTRADPEISTTFSCFWDQTVDDNVASDQSCSELTGEPAIKFDPTSGVLAWQPPSSAEGIYEFRMAASNSYGEDEVIFIVSVGESTESKIKLNYIRDQYIFAGDTLSLDATNQKTGDDSGVSYACYYDAVVDGVVGGSLSCDILPGSPAQKFNPLTGELNWTPDLGQQTEIEIRIRGSKDGDTDEQIFMTSYSTQRFGEVGNSAITFDPNSWDFGSVSVNEASPDKSITLTNEASSDIYIGGLGMSNNEFVINWNSCPSPPDKFESEQTCVVNVSYEPVTAAQIGAFLTVNFGKTAAASSEYSSVLGLSGRGVGQLNFDGLQTITDVEHNALTLNWNETAQAASFLLFQVDGNSLTYLETLLNTAGTVTSKRLTGLQPNTTYTYRVRATDYVGVVDNNTQDVSATTDANNAPSISAGPAGWQVFTGRTIADIDFNDNFTGNDLDRDDDNISYTCHYDNNVDGTVDTSDSGNLCTSLNNIDASNPSFNQFTGVFSGWKPPVAAEGVDFEFKVVASDVYGDESSTSFTTTVANGNPIITAVDDAIFPSDFIQASDTYDMNFDNIRFSPYSDTDMSYTCTVTRLAPTDGASDDCSNLPGTPSFNSDTGVLAWVPGNGGIGAWEFTVEGANLVGSHDRTFKIAVLPDIGVASRIFHIDARFADLSRSGQNGAGFLTTWSELTGSGDDITLNNFDTSSAWNGLGTSASPTSLIFDGTDDYGSLVNPLFADDRYVRFDSWLFPGNNPREKVIFSYGDANENGLILTSSRLWFGNGSSSYASEVLNDNPSLYWRFSDISNGTAADASGNNNVGNVTNGGDISNNVDDATFDLADAAVYFKTNGQIRPNGGAIDIGNDWTIETWFYYPFPNSCSESASWCTLTRGQSTDHQIIVYRDQRLGSYLNGDGGFQYSGYNLSSLKPGWHHLAAVGNGGSETIFYIDGSEVGSIPKQSTSDIYTVGNYQGGRQAFGYTDEFAYYPTALSAARIAAHYDAGKQTVCNYHLPDGYWYNVSGVIDELDNTASLYLNGRPHCSIPLGSASLDGSTADFTIGRSNHGAATSWDGRLQSLILYDSGDTNEILTNYEAGAAAFDDILPVPPSGMRLWLRSDQGLYQDINGDTVASANDDPVGLWQDMSGNLGHMASLVNDPEDKGHHPILKTNALNGHPVVEFDGVDDIMRNFTVYGEPNTIFLVARYNGDTRGRVLAGTSNNWLLGFYNGYVDEFYAQGWVYHPRSNPDNSWRIYAADHSSNDVQRLFRNNVILQTGNGGSQGPIGLTLGCYRESNQASTAQIAEVLVYDRVLTDEEREAIFEYLNMRYNIY